MKSQSGCDWYRCEQPLLHARLAKALDVRFFYVNESLTWFGTEEKAQKLEADLDWADVLFIPRLSEGRLLETIKEFRKMGKRVVTEWDDDFFHVSPLTQQYKDYGLEEYSHQLPNGDKLDVWKDGQNIDLARNRDIRAAQIEGIGNSDMLLVTTDELANLYAPYQKNIRVCPNSINVNLWKKLPLVEHQGLRMGWFGGDSHYEDWLIVAPVLKQFMDENPSVTLVIMGAKFDGTLKGIDPKRIEHHQWAHIMAYPYKAAMLDLDFGIIPLKDNEFNRGKSSVKWLEMAALEVPCATSYVKPYSAMMDLVTDNGVFVETNDPNAWYDGMTLLANEPMLRRRMGGAARLTVERFFDANKTWSFWAKALEECMKKEEATA